MPKQLLPVKHSQQEEAAGCLAACAQMVLSRLSITVSQRDLNRLFGLMDVGTRYTHLQRLSRYRVRVSIEAGDEDDLRAAIDQGIPPVLFLRTGQLTSYWQVDVRHALIVVGYDDTHFYLNDPAFPDSPKLVTIDELMLAWLEFDYMYALITR